MIPTDLLPEILCRLPSKDLLTLKVVSKDWLRLITNRKFIKKHLERSKASCDEPIILVTSLSISQAQINIIDYANSTSTAKPCLRGARLLGSCDGLVLYLNIYYRKISAVNPSTGKSVLVVGIPSPPRETLLSSWFGHHPCTGACALVLVSLSRSPTRRLVFDVYTLYHGCTLTPCCASEEIDGPYCFFFENVGTLLRGRLHCLAMLSVSGDSTILRYDFETTKVDRMWCPQQKYAMLGVVDGCLCSMDRTEIHELGLGFELSVMREYGVKESWMKLAKIEGFDHYFYKLTPFAFCPNGDVVLCDSKRLEWVKYSFREKEIKFLKKYTTSMGGGGGGGGGDGVGVGVACVGSLVSPASIWS